MREKSRMLVVLCACVGLAILRFAMPEKHFATTTGNSRGASADALQNPALTDPDQFNWQLFVEINKAAQAGSATAVWETWAADEDVYDNPNVKPIWPGSSPQLLMQRARSKKLRPITQLQVGREELRQIQRRRRGRRRAAEPLLQFLPPQAAGEEVRMNKTAFDFVVGNDLWYIQGQEAAFKKGDKIDFPPDAKEIKAIWRPISEAQKPRYHWAGNPLDGNKPYGLVALHVISKALPNWTWATFEQVDNPNRCKVEGCHDSFGLTPDGQVSPALLKMFGDAGLGSEWQYYRLDGSQVDFVNASSQPTILGNSVTENGFMLTSSCITCHARSTIGPPLAGKPGANRLSVFQPPPPPPTPPDRLLSYNGAPDPKWFFTDPANPATLKYLQLDFAWSFRRARRRTP